MLPDRELGQAWLTDAKGNEYRLHGALRPRQWTEQIVVRVDPDLLARLRADAEANGRTLTQTVRHLLRRSLDAE